MDASKDARDAAEPIPLGSPLRDASVDPKPWDYLPPTNAGEADPHGPLVVSPGIHGEGPKGIRPGDVLVHDTNAQAVAETALAQAVLVEGQDKPAAIAAAETPIDRSPEAEAARGNVPPVAEAPSRPATATEEAAIAATSKAEAKAAKRGS